MHLTLGVVRGLVFFVQGLVEAGLEHRTVGPGSHTFQLENYVHVWYRAGHKGSRKSGKRVINHVRMAREAHEDGGAGLGRWD